MLRPISQVVTVLVALLVVSCSVRIRTAFEPPPAPPPGTGNVAISMTGDWRVARSVPTGPVEVSNGSGPFAMMPPAVEHMIRFAGGELVASGEAAMRLEDMWDAGEWTTERYVNLSTGKVAYYALERSRVENGVRERQELGLAIGTVNSNTMLAFVEYLHDDEGRVEAGNYLIQLRR